jgi:hypothetical protein
LQGVLSVTELRRNYTRTNRDCFPAALSSMTTYDYESMPKLKHLIVKKILYPTGMERWAVWCRKNRVKFKDVPYIPTDLLYIGLYVVPKYNELHAVVCYNGGIVHNPSRGMFRCSMSEHARYMIIIQEV